MVSRFRSRWQQIKKHWVATGVVGIALVVVISLIISVVWFNGTGFNGYNQVTIAHTTSGPSAGTVVKTEVYQPGKSLWDWLQLLIVPLALAGVALVFQLANTRTERQIAQQRYEQEQQIALDKQREDLLQSYLDRISELLLNNKLRSTPSEEVRNVAQVRTMTVLCQLDARRVGFVFAFLRKAGLMSAQSNDSIVSLREADLRAVNWSQADLWEANLSRAILSYANLSRATLNYANLSGAFLLKANLSGAFLLEVNLSGANLSGTNLKGATGITIEELEKQAKSLKGATMPDGSKHA